MKRIIILISLFIGLLPFSFAQIFVQYDIPFEIIEVENAHVDAWENVKSVDGYRIQLYSASGNNSKKNAQSIYNQFVDLFPDILPYLSYSEPYFRVRVGNYRNRFEAAAALLQIKTLFPGAFVTQDKISFREI